MVVHASAYQRVIARGTKWCLAHKGTTLSATLAVIGVGNIGGAANAVEQSLADLVPTAISLLANILGLGGIGAKVREQLQDVIAAA